MFGWVGNIVNAVVDFVTGGGNDEPGEPDPCDVGGCLEALENLSAARNDVAHACYLINAAMVPIRAAIWVFSRSLWEYILFAIIAVFLGPIGLFFAGLIIVASYATLRVGIPLLATFGRGLAEAFAEEATALVEVQAECPAECQGNQNPSECNVMGESVTIPSNPVTNWLGLSELSTRINGR